MSYEEEDTCVMGQVYVYAMCDGTSVRIRYV